MGGRPRAPPPSLRPEINTGALRKPKPAPAGSLENKRDNFFQKISVLFKPMYIGVEDGAVRGAMSCVAMPHGARPRSANLCGAIPCGAMPCGGLYD